MKIEQHILTLSGEQVSVMIADTFWLRLRGLLLRSKLSANECMLLTKCRSIHTLGMHYRLDVIFLDESGVVTQVNKGVRPFGAVSAGKETKSVVEFVSNQATIAQVGKPLFKRGVSSD